MGGKREMKRLRFSSRVLAMTLALTVAFVMATAFLIGCGGGNKSLQEEIVGTWQEVDIDEVYTFDSDGNGVQVIFDTTYRFTWKIDGDTLKIVDKDYDIEEVYTKVSVQGDTLRMAHGEIAYEYKKTGGN
jgi:hypothetical protein